MKKQILLFFLFLYTLPCTTQDLFPDLDPVFKEDVVSRIDIVLPQDSLDEILAPGNEESNYHFHATFYFDNGEILDTVENIGFRLRGNTSRSSQKKSFKVSFNTYDQGRKWKGLEKLNLNGEHNDPSVSRSKICWDLLRVWGVPGSRASHARLYINGDYFGIYANVEHIDEEFVDTRFGNQNGNLFKCLWPADLVYLGDDPDLYKYSSGGRRAYDLLTNKEADDYSDLAELIDILNNTPASNLRCALEEVFNIHTFLKSMAFDIMAGNWDGPLFNKNNFYLYHNEETDKFEYIPYDLDNTFGIDWFSIDWAQRNIYNWAPSNQPRPLYWKILEVQEYRDRLSYLLDKMISEYYNESVFFPKIDATRNLIFPYVLGDAYYSLDYGFSQQDFTNSFFQPLDYNHTPFGIKDFITARKNATISQLELNDIAPIITNVSNNLPNANQDISIIANVEEDNGVIKSEVCYKLNGVGDFVCVEMFDDGMHGDDSADDGLFGGIIPAIGASVEMEYQIRVLDNRGKQQVEPFCGTNRIFIREAVVELAINEFMASNSTVIADEFDEFDDWVEIYNYGGDPVYLGDKYLSDNPDNPTKWGFPNIWIQSGDFLLVWTDDDEEQGELHTNYKLSAAGEYIGIYDSDAKGNGLLDGLAFGPQETDQSFGRIPNGTGSFQVLVPSPGASNENATGVADDFNLLTYQMYPNPAHDVIHLESTEVMTEPQEILLFNVFGQITMRVIWSGSLSLQIGHIPNGIYFVYLKDAGSMHILGKVIKE